MKWYRLSADQGNDVAQCILSYCYETGKGVPQNHDESVKWEHQAIESGQSDAQCNLVDCHIQW